MIRRLLPWLWRQRGVDRRAALECQLDAALAARRADRAARNARARAGAATKIHQAYQRDPLRNEMIEF